MSLLTLAKPPDSEAEIAAFLDQGADRADLILTSGGASAGDEDHVSRLLRERGRLTSWRIAVKPGRPLAMAMWNGVPVLGLPGNPVAAFTCTLVFARPALSLLAGAGWHMPQGPYRARRLHQTQESWAARIPTRAAKRRRCRRGFRIRRVGAHFRAGLGRWLCRTARYGAGHHPRHARALHPLQRLRAYARRIRKACVPSGMSCVSSSACPLSWQKCGISTKAAGSLVSTRSTAPDPSPFNRLRAFRDRQRAEQSNRVERVIGGHSGRALFCVGPKLRYSLQNSSLADGRKLASVGFDVD